MDHTLPRRLRRLPRRGDHVVEAASPLARLLGLAGLRPDQLPPATALHLPRTRSVHTVGMRFALDLVWLDDDGVVVRIDRAVAPNRVRVCLTARSVLETAAREPRPPRRSSACDYLSSDSGTSRSASSSAKPGSPPPLPISPSDCSS
jgi:uncharacterized membrane protein (UPF0127 family)